MNLTFRLIAIAIMFLAATATLAGDDLKLVTGGPPLPGTKRLTLEGDIAAKLVDGVDRFLLRKIDESEKQRDKFWKRDFSTASAYRKSIEPNRKRLAHILGVRDKRVPFDAPELVSTTKQSALVGKAKNYDIFAVRWPVLSDPDPRRNTVTIHGEGLLLVPSNGKKPVADVVAIGDVQQTPEQLVGLADGVPAQQRFAHQLASAGCRVLVPVLINRDKQQRGGVRLTNREYLYRSAFELGRHLIGYEVQKVLAGVDWFTKEAGSDKAAKIGVYGHGEGGMIALYAAALDHRIDSLAVSGYFGDRRKIWKEPIDRNVFGLLEQFGDAELLLMTLPNRHILANSPMKEVVIPGSGGAPARLVPQTKDGYGDERERAIRIVDTQKPIVRQFDDRYASIGFGVDFTPDNFRSSGIVSGLLSPLGYRGGVPEGSPPTAKSTIDPAARQNRQIAEIDRHNQLLLRESPFVRRQFMKKLYDVASKGDMTAYEKAAEEYREHFATQVVGRFDDQMLPPNVRTRKTYDEPKWTGYEVVMDVFPDVIAYGILLLPKDITPGERRPVVVCQHGLEGRPQSVIGKKDYHYYKAFAAKLAERGYITFAPQNLYIGQGRFRTLQRKANPLGKTLFSIMVPQHQQITDWLGTLPQVDPKRIAFYGLSYGGKSAMQIPPLVKNYCLSICSADFNDWVDKCASTRSPRSYIWTGEYEIFEFDLGSTFNYAETAALIAPRPFMVERGHFDRVGDDWAVAWEFAKVRNLYAVRLKIPERCEIEWFLGPHTINEQGTYAFLRKHLK